MATLEESEADFDMLLASKEEEVKIFLGNHPEIEKNRVKQIEKIKNGLKSKKIIKMQRLMNKKGMVAKCLYPENGDMCTSCIVTAKVEIL